MCLSSNHSNMMILLKKLLFLSMLKSVELLNISEETTIYNTIKKFGFALKYDFKIIILLFSKVTFTIDQT